VLTCAVCVEGEAGGRRRGASTVTAGNAGAIDCCCVGVAGADDASGCAVGASCAGAPGEGGGAEGAFCAGVLGDDDDGDSSDCVLPCSAGGVACARAALTPAAASAMVLTESSASFATALMQ
jgi:hypothetical protein